MQCYFSGVQSVSKSNNMSKERDNKMDDQADEFARCLLMPKDLFIRNFYELCNKMEIHKIAVELGKTFQVETTMAAMRIFELGLHKRTNVDKVKAIIDHMDDISEHQDKTY